MIKRQVLIIYSELFCEEHFFQKYLNKFNKLCIFRKIELCKKYNNMYRMFKKKKKNTSNLKINICMYLKEKTHCNLIYFLLHIFLIPKIIQYFQLFLKILITKCSSL